MQGPNASTARLGDSLSNAGEVIAAGGGGGTVATFQSSQALPGTVKVVPVCAFVLSQVAVDFGGKSLPNILKLVKHYDRPSDKASPLLLP